jgi:hypothetical protein
VTRSIIPLPTRTNDSSELTDLDRIAAELLADGQAATLSAARIGVLPKKISTQRTELVGVIADLEGRTSTGNDSLDKVNADLLATANEGLAHIDRLIQLVEAWPPTPSGSDPRV